MNNLGEGHGLRPAPVLAAALAAITAAFLGSRLGVYGTVIGAGMVSVVTTVGGELYLRSLQRTKDAAKRTKDVALTRGSWTSLVDSVDEQRRAAGEPVDEQAEPMPVEPVETEPVETEPAEVSPEPRRRLRWPALAVGAVVAFVLGMAAVTGIEALTGNTLSGERGSSVSNMLRGGDAPAQAPVEDEPVDEQSSTTEPPANSSTTESSTPPSTEKSTKPAPPAESTTPTTPTEPPEETTTPSEPTDGAESTVVPPWPR